MPVIKSGAGLMVMSGANTYVGPTTVAAGTLQIGNGGSGEALASPSISVSSGAVLAFNQTDTLTDLAPAGISGGGALLKFGSGTLVLGSTNNAYSGGTTVNAGVLTATNSGALPGFASAGSISAASGATVAVSMSGWATKRHRLVANHRSRFPPAPASDWTRATAPTPDRRRHARHRQRRAAAG